MLHPEDPKDNGTRVPGFTYAWMIPWFTRIGRRHGYAMAFHGSMGRDLDVVAIPWVQEANDPKELLADLCQVTGGTLLETSIDKEHDGRPHGRMAYNITFPGSWHFVDISIMPRIPVTHA